MRRALLILSGFLIIAMAATAAGCGGGGKRLTKDEFIAKADGICATANKNIPPTPPNLRQGFDPTAGKGTDAQYKSFGAYLDKVVKVFRSEIDDLHGLKPPSDLQDTYDKALATLDEAINEIRDAASAAKSGDRATVKSKFAESQKHSNDGNKLARELGLTVCGSG